MMVQGPVEEKILRQAYRRGLPPPEAMANAPEIRPELAMFWVAFERLSTCRPYIGMQGVPGPIPWTAIAQYARDYRFSGQGYYDLVTIITKMDEAYRQQALSTIGKSHGQPPGVSAANGQTGNQGGKQR